MDDCHCPCWKALMPSVKVVSALAHPRTVQSITPKYFLDTLHSISRGAPPTILNLLVEQQPVSERVDKPDATGAPGRLLDARVLIAVVLRCKPPMKGKDACTLHPHRRSGTGVAMMFRKMKNQRAQRHLHVKRRVVVQSMLPVNLEAHVVHIELPGLVDAEDPQDRDRSVHLQCVGVHDIARHHGGHPTRQAGHVT